MLYTQFSLQNGSFTDEKHDILVSLLFKCIMGTKWQHAVYMLKQIGHVYGLNDVHITSIVLTFTYCDTKFMSLRLIVQYCIYFVYLNVDFVQ